jgi:hypothetical protein
MSILVDVCIHMIYLYLYFSFSLSLLSIYMYIFINTIPLWNLLVSILLLCFTVIFACFAFKSSQHFFHSFEDFGCLNVMNYDVSCVHTMTYFDGICIVFDYRIVLPTKGFNSNMDRMRTDLWPNVNFKLLHEFFTMFLFLLVTHEISDFVRFQILQTYYLMINMVDMSLAFFSLLCSFCLLFHYCSGSILWMMCGS